MKLVGVSGLKVYLVFVVPKGMNDFKKQEVDIQNILAEHCSVNELPGIGPKGAEKLKSKGMITVKQLQHAVETDQTLQSYKKKLDTFREIESQKELLNGIHQYLLVTEGDYKRCYVRYT
jgi:nucleotidyltransferase/DNA polymerase involved in DNA repair